MKPNVFKYSVLNVGVVAAMGISTGAMAATQQTATISAVIANQATATYNVATAAQTGVTSNTVTINIEEIAAFSLVAINEDTDTDNSTNTGIEVIPTGIAAYNHTLSNTGNLTDTYTMALLSSLTATQLGNISVSYIIYESIDTVATTSSNAAGNNVANVTGTTFDTSTITLEAGQYAEIVINETTVDNVGGDTQNLTLTATSNYFTQESDTKTDDADVTNINDLITKLPVFGIVKTVTNPLDLNNSDDAATYSITVTNDDGGSYAADATDITIFDNLPAGLKLVANSVTSTDAVGTTSVTENGNGAGTGTTGTDGFTYSGIDLAKGDSVTITFEVKTDPNEDGQFEPTATVNHARVEVTLDPSGALDPYTVVDSTDSTGGGQNTGILTIKLRATVKYLMAMHLELVATQHRH